MSTSKSVKFKDIGTRIVQERKKLGYSQTTLAAKLGRSKSAQISYEANETRPDADYFFALDELGADIYYIITGRELAALKKQDELKLLRSYRTVDDRHKMIILNLAEDIAQSDFPNKITTDTGDQ